MLFRVRVKVLIIVYKALHRLPVNTLMYPPAFTLCPQPHLHGVIDVPWCSHHATAYRTALVASAQKATSIAFSNFLGVFSPLKCHLFSEVFFDHTECLIYNKIRTEKFLLDVLAVNDNLRNKPFGGVIMAEARLMK